MNEKIELKTFPEDKVDALALAYVTSQDLSGKTPEGIARMYSDAYSRIFSELKAIAKEKKAAKSPYQSMTGI